MKKVRGMVRNILYILAIMLLLKTIVSYQLAKTEYSTYDYSVKGNDTLWTIATKICSENDNLYIRKVIVDIKDINNLDDSIIYIGQTIKLPIYN